MSKETMKITRLDLIVIGLLAVVITGSIFYAKHADASEVELAPVPEAVDVEPVNDPSAVDRLKEWLRSLKSDEPEDPSVVVKMEGQRLSSETVDELERIFNDTSGETTERIVSNAKIDAKQIDCLVRNQVFEAAGESKLGQLWVYHVVKNRTDKQYRGNKTMCETIFDPKQFSWANTNPDRVPEFQADVDVATALVEQLYFDPDLEDITCGATHYLKKDIMWDVDWSREALLGKSSEDLELIAIIGKHAFFGKPEC